MTLNRTEVWTSQTGTTTFSKSSEAPKPAKASVKTQDSRDAKRYAMNQSTNIFFEQKKLEDTSESGGFTLRLRGVVAMGEPLASSCSSLYYGDKVSKTMARAIEKECYDRENEQKLR